MLQISQNVQKLKIRTMSIHRQYTLKQFKTMAAKCQAGQMNTIFGHYLLLWKLSRCIYTAFVSRSIYVNAVSFRERIFREKPYNNSFNTLKRQSYPSFYQRIDRSRFSNGTCQKMPVFSASSFFFRP